MNALLFWSCAALFAGLPPLLLLVRFLRGRPAWWLILTAIALVGWASWLGIVVFHFERLGDQIDAMPNPPAELVDAWAGDGGPKAFAMLYGWAAAAVYSAAWYIVFLLLLILRRLFGYRGKSDRLKLRIVNRASLGTSDDAR